MLPSEFIGRSLAACATLVVAIELPRGFEIAFAFHAAQLQPLKEAARAQRHMTLPALLNSVSGGSGVRPLRGVSGLWVFVPIRRRTMDMVRFSGRRVCLDKSFAPPTLSAQRPHGRIGEDEEKRPHAIFRRAWPRCLMPTDAIFVSL